VLWDKSGSVERVKVVPRLVRADDETQLWTASYNERLTEIFDIQSRIAEQIAVALDVTLHANEKRALVRPPPASPEAYVYYLRGNEFFNSSWGNRDIQIAIDMYQRAVELDDKFARAWAMLCRGHESMYWEYFDHTLDRLDTAQKCVDRALKLQPDLMEGHLALGFLHYHRDRDYDRALAEFHLALESSPNCAELYNAIAAVKRRQGKLEESVSDFIRALELDPLSRINAFETGLTFGMMRQYHLAQQYVEKAQMLAPDWPLTYVYMAWLHIFRDGNIALARRVLATAEGRCDLWQSKYHWWLARIVQSDYRAILNRMHSGPDTVDYYSHCGRICRLLADTAAERAYADSAMRLLESQNRMSATDAKTLMYLGLAHAGLRQNDEAQRYARSAVEQLPTSRDAFDALFLVIDFAEVLVIAGDHDAAL
jgi:tetratricopeptide (TPR) repeat protein